MSDIIALEVLKGSISPECNLSGTLSAIGGLTAKLSIANNYDSYVEKYEVVPLAFLSQTLNTANKLLRKNIVVSQVPYYETSNLYDGTTAYIAKEI